MPQLLAWNIGTIGRITLRLDRSKASGWISVIACRSEEHTSELQSLMRISYAVFCLKKKTKNKTTTDNTTTTTINKRVITKHTTDKISQTYYDIPGLYATQNR